MWGNTFGRIAALALAMFLPTEASAAARPFNVERDAATAERCFGTYFDLASATNGSASEPQKAWFSQASAGAERIMPYVDAIAHAQGEGIYARVASENMVTKKELEGLSTSNPERQRRLAALAANAAQCGRSLDDWAAAGASAAPAARNNPDPDAVARSLIDATRTICIPYVVGGTPLDKLVQRQGIAKRVDLVNGVEVTRFVIGAPGSPVVTPSPERDFGVGPDGERVISHTSCWMSVSGDPEFARQVVSRFRGGLVLGGYQTTSPHPVQMWGVLREGPPIVLASLCVHGRTEALVTASNPDFRFEGPNAGFFNSISSKFRDVEVDVESDPTVLEAEGCVPLPPSALVPTPVQAWSACMGVLPGFTQDQKIEGCTVVLTSRYDPSQDWAHYNNRGVAYDSEGQHDRAIQDFEAALRLKPDDATARANLEKARRAVVR